MILPRLISWPYARKHPARWLLTTFGIVLGVSIFVGMHAAGGAVLSGLNETVDRIAGKTELQVTAGESGFPEDVLERVQSVEAVAVAVPALEAVVQTENEREGNLMILAVDMTGDRSLRDYDMDSGDEDIVEDPLVFLAQPDSLIVTKEFAERNGLRVNRTVTMQTMDGHKTFTVRGMMNSTGLGSAFGGNLAVMDIYAAQKIFGRGERFDRIDLRLKDGYSLQQGQLEVSHAVGPGFQVEPPAARGRQFESLLKVYTLTVEITSLFALFIGMFIIYGALAIAVTQRRTEIGILRTLGATQGQVISLVLLESAIAGLIGSALGVVFGAAMAKVVARYVGDVTQALSGVATRAGAVHLSPALVVSAIAVGVTTSIVAAMVPALTAATVDPVKALQKGRIQALSAGQNRTRRRVAVVLGVAAGALMTVGRSQYLFFPGYACFLLSAFLIVPTLSLWLSRFLRPLLKVLRPVEGVLAADSLIRAPRRTSPTIAALMFSVGLIVSLGGVSRSTYESVADWANTALNPNLFVSASENLVDRSFHFPDSMTMQLASINGIAELQRMRTAKVQMPGGSALLAALDMEVMARRTRGRSVVAGDFDQMHRLAAQGKGAIVSENFSLLQNAGLNDVLEIPSPGGVLRLPIVGIVRDYTYQSGSVLIDYSLYLKHWNDPTVDIYQVYLDPSASANDVKRQINAAFGATHRLFVFLSSEVKGRVLSNTEQWLNLVYIQITIAILVAILGIASTLSVSILDRRREFAVLRAVGGIPFQIRLAVWLEALAIVIIGVVLGVIFGALDLSYELELVRRYYAGMTLDYRFPTGLVLTLFPIMLGAGVISAFAPSESAVRGSLVEALEEE
jgi:putative ABC transport system permease protein